MTQHLASVEVLFHLFPFGVFVDPEGKVIHLGKTIQKVMPIAIDDNLVNFLKLKDSDESKHLPEAFQMFWLKSENETIKIRGQLLPVEDGFFFTGTMGLNNTKVMKEYDLTFKDFSNQENIFDFLMLLGSQEHSIDQLRRILDKLKIKNNLSSFVNKVAVEIDGMGKIEDIYRLLENNLRKIFPDSGVSWSKVRRKLNDKGEVFLEPITSVFKLDGETGLTLQSSEEEINWFAGEVKRHQELNTPYLMAPNGETKNYTSVLSAIDADDHHFAIISIQDVAIDLMPEETIFGLISRLIQSKIATISAEKQKADMLLHRIHLGRIAMLGELSAGVAHEINNPLAIISFMFEKINSNLTDDGVFPKYREDLEVVRNSIDRIVKIIQGLKIYARGGTSDRHMSASIKKIFVDTWVLMQSKYKQHGIDFKWEIEDESLAINCSSVQIVQILTNLLSNSADAIANLNDRTVRMTCHRFQNHVRIEVRDSGPAIPSDVVEKIMNPFFTTKEPGKGTGLGLSLSHTIAIQHKGKLYLDQGQPETCFVLELPLNS